MKTIYSDEPPLPAMLPSIFLAGPTPRSKDVPSWRPEAIEILKKLNYKHYVCIPEFKHGEQIDYLTQVNWEKQCLHYCSQIVFWVPRNMENMPALTTNCEFGFWMAKNPGKVYYGRPDHSVHNRYLDWLYEDIKKEKPFTELSKLLEHVCLEEKL